MLTLTFSFSLGFLSVLNHLSSQVPPPDQNLLVIPIIRTRVGNMATVNELRMAQESVALTGSLGDSNADYNLRSPEPE